MKKNRLLDSADHRQHFSLRKLSIGTVSVLLGTTLYLGGVESAHIYAATADNEQTVNVSVASDDSKQQGQATTPLADNKAPQPAQAAANFQNSARDGKRTNFVIEGKKKSISGESITLKFDTNDMVDGTEYKIVIPEVDENLNASGTYKVIPAPLERNGDYGKTDTIYDENKKEWTVTDTFNKSATSSQEIELQIRDRLPSNVKNQTGTFERPIYLYKDGKMIENLTFDQKVTTFNDLLWGWNQGDGFKDSIYTLDGNKVTGKILANTDYEWRFRFILSPEMNWGTTIKVPMPENFVLNTGATEKANDGWREDYKATVGSYKATADQKGDSVQFTLPSLTEDEIAEITKKYGESTIANMRDVRASFIGQFKMEQPLHDETISVIKDLPTIKDPRPKIYEFTRQDQTEASDCTIDPVTVTIAGETPGEKDAPIGELITGQIEPDEYELNENGSYKYDKPVTALEKKEKLHALNKQISFGNASPYELDNVTATITVPDGMDITSLGIKDTTHRFSYQFELVDGTTTEWSDYIGNQWNDSVSERGQKISKIYIKVGKLKAYEMLNDFSLLGTLSDSYKKDGTPVKVGDSLTTHLDVSLDDKTAHFVQSQNVVAKSPGYWYRDFYEIKANTDQTKLQVGDKDAGFLEGSAVYLPDNIAELTYYVVLPTNATTDLSNIEELPVNAKISAKQVDGRTIVKINGKFERNKVHWRMKLDNETIITDQNKLSDYSIMVVLPEGKAMNKNYGFTYKDDPKWVDNSKNVYKISHGDWRIIAAEGTYPTTKAQGNLDPALTMTGTSDDKGSSQMTFSSVLVNSKSDPLQDVTVLTHVPRKTDQKSEFDFKLQKDGVSVRNKLAGDIDDQGAKFYFSKDEIDFDNAHDDPNLKQHFISQEDMKDEDWDQVKTVMTVFPSVAANSTYTVELKGSDPTFSQDVNKTAYTGTAIWSSMLNPVIVKPGDKNSASVTIAGKSTVNFKLHYVDDHGQDQYISVPDVSKDYRDGIDTLLKDDFIKADKNSDFDDAVNKKNYSKVPKAIIDAVPEDYVIDIESGYHINNADVHYENGSPNNPAAFDQTAMYYFDGDTVVYNLVKKKIFSRNVIIKRKVQFINGNDSNQPLQDDLIEEVSMTVFGLYNPLTNTVSEADLQKSMETLKDTKLDKFVIPATINDLRLSKVNVNNKNLPVDQSNLPVDEKTKEKYLDQIGAITIYENTGPAPITRAISNYLADHPEQVNKDGQVYHANGWNELTPAKGATSEPATITFTQNLIATYASAYANLILLGQGLGEDNQLLSQSSLNDGDQIVFKNGQDKKHTITDQDLTRDGYRYKIYYTGGKSLQKLVSLTAEGSMWDELVKKEAWKYINLATLQKWAKNPRKLKLEEFDSLAEALSTNQAYDDVSDGVNSDGTTYSQNFFVVYTPTEERPQTLYILSDNDPLANVESLKQYALPKTTADADKSKTDYFKVTGQTGQPLIKNGGYNRFDARLTFSEGNYDSVTHTPSVPKDDMTLSALAVYNRSGYYIDQATYTYKDAQGQEHKAEIKVAPKGDSPDTFYLQNRLLYLVDYLASGFTAIGWDNPLQDSNTQFSILVDGVDRTADAFNDEGELSLPTDQAWSFDNTEYDNQSKQNLDPAPQVINLHYALLPVISEGEAYVKIHYVDVDGVAPLTDEQKEELKQKGIILDESTSRYTYQSSSKELHEPVTITIPNDHRKFDNTASDDRIIAELANQGYIVVQRDKQTRGEHQYDPYAEDATNKSLDGNQLNSNALSGGWPYNWKDQPEQWRSAPQSYYVYLKKVRQLNYQVVLEDHDGNELQVITASQLLGKGATDELVATSLVDPTDAKSQTIAEKYQSIIDGQVKSGYHVVASDSTSTKLKKTDSLTNLKFIKGAPQLVTIYVTQGQGNIRIHYIDVDGKTPDADGNYQPSDGTEISGKLKTISDLNYGDEYNNQLWNYDEAHYKLATPSVPEAAIKGTISQPENDVYVYLKHQRTETTETHEIHETIHYVFNDGTKAFDDYTATTTLTRTETTDLVTKEKTWSGWTTGKFDAVDSPMKEGYTVDIPKIEEITVNYGDSDIEKTVTYTPIPSEDPGHDFDKPKEPEISDQPDKPDKSGHPDKPDESDNPTNPTTPAEPSNDNKETIQSDHRSLTKTNIITTWSNSDRKQQKTLPQTGSANAKASVAGLILLGLVGMLEGLDDLARRKKRH